MQACPWLLLVLPLFACAKASPIEARGGFHPVAYPPGVQSGIKAIIDGGRAFEPEGMLRADLRCAEEERLTPRDSSHARGRLISLEREQDGVNMAEAIRRAFGLTEVQALGGEADDATNPGASSIKVSQS